MTKQINKMSLVNAIVAAMNAAYEQDCDFDVRYYANDPENMRIRAVETECADGGEVLISRIDVATDAEASAEAVLVDIEERAELAAAA